MCVLLSLLGNGSVKKSLYLGYKRLDENVAALTNTHARMDELSGPSCPMLSVSHEGA
jgi:hypothetical protein